VERHTSKFLVVLTFWVLLFSATPLSATSSRASLAIPLPPTATPLDFLSLELESEHNVAFNSETHFSLDYASNAPNTIVVLVRYSKQASAEDMDITISTARALIQEKAGWLSVVITKQELDNDNNP
jgi:hypothetical protein